jgi:hypothetical protein
MTRCILLAGGLGTRLRDAVPGIPKCLAVVHGENERLFQPDDHGVCSAIGQLAQHVAVLSHYAARYLHLLRDLGVVRVSLMPSGSSVA